MTSQPLNLQILAHNNFFSRIYCSGKKNLKCLGITSTIFFSTNLSVIPQITLIFAVIFRNKQFSQENVLKGTVYYNSTQLNYNKFLQKEIKVLFYLKYFSNVRIFILKTMKKINSCYQFNINIYLDRERRLLLSHQDHKQKQ